MFLCYLEIIGNNRLNTTCAGVDGIGKEIGLAGTSRLQLVA